MLVCARHHPTPQKLHAHQGDQGNRHQDDAGGHQERIRRVQQRVRKDGERLQIPDATKWTQQP